LQQENSQQKYQIKHCFIFANFNQKYQFFIMQKNTKFLSYKKTIFSQISKNSKLKTLKTKFSPYQKTPKTRSKIPNPYKSSTQSQSKNFNITNKPQTKHYAERAQKQSSESKFF
jgi:cyclophilin family peptidyl-prolyl cis-trans isomerase